MAILGTLLLWLLWILLALLAVILLVLLFPVDARASGAVWDGEPEGAARVRWAWGLLSVRAAFGRGASLHLCGLRVAGLGGGPTKKEKAAAAHEDGPDDADDADEEKAAKKKAKRQARKEKATKRGGQRLLAALLQSRSTLVRVARRFLRALHLRGGVEGTVGLGDPAQTAKLQTVVENLLGGRRAFALGIAYDYLDARCDLRGGASAKVWVPQLVAIAVGSLLRRDVRQLIRALR